MPNRNYNGIQSLPAQVKIPEYYDIPAQPAPKNFKEFLEENPVYSALKPMVGTLIEHPLWSLGAWLGFGWLMDKYTNACDGKYETSLLKKTADFGDKIQESKVVQSKPAQAVLQHLKKMKEAGGRFVNRHQTLKSMKETPTNPEWTLTKASMYSQKQEVVQDFFKITDGLKLDSAGMAEMSEIGVDKAEKEMLKKIFKVKSISEIPEEKAVSQVLLHRLGKPQAEIDKIINLERSARTSAVKDSILKEMGLSANKLHLMREDMFEKYAEDVKEASKRVGNKVRIRPGHYGWMGPLTKPFERNLGCDGVYNRLHSMGSGAKTATGRFMSKFLQMAHRGLTFGGGKLGILIFIAPALVEVGMNVKKAENRQKVATGVNTLVDSISWVFTFPLALKMMHTFGGVKYSGMGKDKVEQYRKIRDDFNLKNKQGLYAKKADYDRARRIAEGKMEKLYNVKGQGFFAKFMRKVGKFMTIDLERLDGRNAGSWYKNIFTKMPNALRNFVGVPLRIGIFALLTGSVIDVAISKCIKFFCGDAYDPMKEEERQEDKKAQKVYTKKDLNDRLYRAQAEKQLKIAQSVNNNGQVSMKGKNINFSASLNPNDVKQENNPDNYTYIPSSKNVIPHNLKDNSVDTYSYIPSSECTLPHDKNKQSEGMRKYVPSQKAANIVKNFDNSGLDDALSRADRAEQKAMQILAGNFEKNK